MYIFKFYLSNFNILKKVVDLKLFNLRGGILLMFISKIISNCLGDQIEGGTSCRDFSDGFLEGDNLDYMYLILR